MRVLVTGAGGLLGGRLAELLARRFTVLAARHRAAPPEALAQVPLDLTDADSLGRAFAESRPDAVVHSAAYADGDRCEREPAAAHALNVDATARLADLCLEKKCRLIALSTDLVLGGRQAWSDESATPEPLLEYARTKLAGERAVLAASPDFVVLRVALVVGRGFGPRGTGSEALLWAIRGGAQPRLFTDQFRTPVDAESVADAIGRVFDGRGTGLYHLGGPERVSRYELGQKVSAAFGLDPLALHPVSAQEQPVGVPRPADCSMDISRARRELSWEPRPLAEALRESRQAPG